MYASSPPLEICGSGHTLPQASFPLALNLHVRIHPPLSLPHLGWLLMFCPISRLRNCTFCSLLFHSLRRLHALLLGGGHGCLRGSIGNTQTSINYEPYAVSESDTLDPLAVSTAQQRATHCGVNN